MPLVLNVRRPFFPDTTPPTTVVLASPNVTGTAVSLSWSAATDSETGVTGYVVYQDGSPLPNLVKALSTTVSNLSPGTHTFEVAARDGAGNLAPRSNLQSAFVGVIIIPGTKIKYHPGYWSETNTVLSASRNISAIQFELDLTNAEPILQGWIGFFTWGHVHTGPNTFNFATIDAIYNYLAAKGKRMAIMMQVGAFTSTHPGSTDGSIIPQHIQQNPAVYGQAAYRVAGVLTTVAGASGWWGGDGNGHTYAASMHRAVVMDEFIKCITAIGNHMDGKPFYEGIYFAENSFWIGAHATNGDGSYNDSDATIQQTRMTQAAVASHPTSNVWVSNTYMRVATAAQQFCPIIINNRATPAQTDTRGRTYVRSHSGFLGPWGVAAVAGQTVSGSTYVGPDYRTRGIHMACEVEAPDLGAFGGVSGGTVPITFAAAIPAGALSANIANPDTWPNGIGYSVRFSNGTIRLCTVTGSKTFTWTGAMGSAATSAATVSEGGSNGWTPQDIVDNVNLECQGGYCFMTIIPDSATYVALDRRWSACVAVMKANPFIHTDYPSNYPSN